MKTMKNILIFIFTVILVFATCVTPAYTLNMDTSIYSISDFYSNPEFATKKLNEVSQAPIQKENTISLYNGNTIKTEVRMIPIDDEVSIINIRTEEYESSSRAKKNITDKYGLYWGGVAGADGWLVAKYTYDYTTIYGPNDMVTTIYSAKGSTEKLSSKIKLKSINANVDLASGYRASAHVTFKMSQTVGGYETESFSYTNRVTFNSYGAYTISW